MSEWVPGPYETITVSTASIGLTAANISKVGRDTKIIAQAVTTGINFRTDGTAPTTAAGIRLDDGDSVTLEGREILHNLRFIRADTTDAAARVLYFYKL